MEPVVTVTKMFCKNFLAPTINSQVMGLRKIPVMEITHMGPQIPVTGQRIPVSAQPIPVSAQPIPVSAQLIPVMVRRTLVTEQPILVTEPQIILHLMEADIFINKLKKTLGLLFSEDSPAKTRFYFQNLPS